MIGDLLTILFASWGMFALAMILLDWTVKRFGRRKRFNGKEPRP
jgi:hypothetical protein